MTPEQEQQVREWAAERVRLAKTRRRPQKGGRAVTKLAAAERLAREEDSVGAEFEVSLATGLPMNDPVMKTLRGVAPHVGHNIIVKQTHYPNGELQVPSLEVRSGREYVLVTGTLPGGFTIRGKLSGDELREQPLKRLPSGDYAYCASQPELKGLIT